MSSSMDRESCAKAGVTEGKQRRLLQTPNVLFGLAGMYLLRRMRS
jgi:hypothetical protein